MSRGNMQPFLHAASTRGNWCEVKPTAQNTHHATKQSANRGKTLQLPRFGPNLKVSIVAEATPTLEYHGKKTDPSLQEDQKKVI